MATKMRSARGGLRNHPHYRIVIANATAPRNGVFWEIVGPYDFAKGVGGLRELMALMF